MPFQTNKCPQLSQSFLWQNESEHDVFCVYLSECKSSWAGIKDAINPEVGSEMQDFPIWLEKGAGSGMFSKDGLDFRKYLWKIMKIHVIRSFLKICLGKRSCKNPINYLPGPRRSRISMFRKGKKNFPQKGHVVLRFESSAVQPAMISSSCTKQSQVRHREQLEMRTCTKQFKTFIFPHTMLDEKTYYPNAHYAGNRNGQH